MSRSVMRGLWAVLALLSQVALTACGSSSSDPSPYIPYTIVNEVLNLTNQENANLRFDNGAVTHTGGLRGLIVVRQNASTYLAFERTCPYQPTSACARVHIDASRLFLTDSCCGSKFDLQGQPISGPAARPLQRYATALSGNLLNINN